MSGVNRIFGNVRQAATNSIHKQESVAKQGALLKMDRTQQENGFYPNLNLSTNTGVNYQTSTGVLNILDYMDSFVIK